MDEERPVSYILEILDDDVLPLEDVLFEIRNAPFPVGEHLTRYVQSLEQLEEFLGRHEDRFFVANRRVAAYDPDLESGRENAVRYFENELNLYDKPPHYLKFRGHIGQAEEDVIDFINSFYPNEEFKEFLLEHSEVFVVFDDDTVFLIENESVDYFEECLENNEGLHFMNFRGHVGQAPHYVIEFINTHYPGRRFLEFLENNSDVFFIEDGYVFLNNFND